MRIECRQERPSPSVYVMMRTSIIAGATVVDTVHDFFISHRFDRTFDRYTVLLRRNRKEAHDAVSTMFLSCVRQDFICHRLFWEIPELRIADTEQGPHADDGTRCLLLRIHGELEAFRAWTGAGSAGHAPGAPQKVSTPAGICLLGGDTDPPSRSARSLAQKSLSDGSRYAMIGPVHRPPFPRWLSNQGPARAVVIPKP